ncbi:Hypothetical protein PHPALM_19971 [Phytophthora palmivora]|uniref:Uncharacterized protein n=1 Tax=Phytophthora palmivora TaxID=4796 RepID=A0A2P4XG23_9STRA|nr:Hypothetical protein PHPALM_19971 [Phytophthora palmivora]
MAVMMKAVPKKAQQKKASCESEEEDQLHEFEELSEDLELAGELEQTDEESSGETTMRAPGKYAHTTHVQLDWMIPWMVKPSNQYMQNYAMKNDPADIRHSSK